MKMPVARPGRWVKGESKSLLARLRTPAPGETARDTVNGEVAVDEPTIAQHDGDRRASWFSWRALVVGCVLGAFSVLAVLRSFPSVAAAIVPTPEPTFAASQKSSEPTRSRETSVAQDGSEHPATPAGDTASFANIVRAHHAKHAAASRDSSKLGRETDDDVASVSRGPRETKKSPRRAGMDAPGERSEKPRGSKHVKIFRLPSLGDEAPSVDGVWREAGGRGARRTSADFEAVRTGNAVAGSKELSDARNDPPVARSGAVAAAEAASRGDVTRNSVDDAAMEDARASTATALDGAYQKSVRRDVRGESF